jgi:hypothetical protein
MTDAETLAHILQDINVLLTNYVDPSNRVRDPNLVLEEIMSAIDRKDGMNAAERILASHTGPGPAD